MEVRIIFNYTSEIKSSFENTDMEVEKIISSLKKELDMDKEVLFRIEFILRELINNSIEHGNKMNLEKKVMLQVEVLSRIVTIDVIDEGEGFDLDKVILHIKNKELLRIRNRGLLSIIGFGFKLKVNGGHVICVGEI